MSINAQLIFHLHAQLEKINEFNYAVTFSVARL